MNRTNWGSGERRCKAIGREGAILELTMLKEVGVNE